MKSAWTVATLCDCINKCSKTIDVYFEPHLCQAQGKLSPQLNNINLPDASLNDVQDTPRELRLIRAGNEWRGWAQASHRWQPFVGSQEYVQLHIYKKISDFTKRGNKHGFTNISLRWGNKKNRSFTAIRNDIEDLWDEFSDASGKHINSLPLCLRLHHICHRKLVTEGCQQ